MTDSVLRKGEILSIELQTAAETVGRRLFARVIHVKEQAPAGWIVGCRFVNKLTEDELSALLT